MKFLRISITFFFLYCSMLIHAQQNLTMYFNPDNPQVNTLNPAFQNTCKLFIGLPVISSLHLNIGNDGFTYKQLFQKDGDNYRVIPSNLNLGLINSFNSEVYTSIFSLGLWVKKNYFTFSINEKSDLAGFYHRDFFNVIFGGNTAYEGKNAKFSNTGIFFDYRREYALGVARKVNPETTFGLKAKLLFGKINVSTRRSNSTIYTDPVTFNVTAFSDFKINSSAPINVTTGADGRISNITYNGSPGTILFNNKNVGFAFDLGFIKKISKEATISASILDLGGIYYTSSPNNYSIAGTYTLNGSKIDTTNQRPYLNQIVYDAFSQFEATLESVSYFSVLPPRLYANYNYLYSPKTNLNAIITAKIYRYKILPAIGIGVNHKLVKNISLALSWSYIDRSLKNIGTGIVIGKSPVQFYAFTDNIFGFTNPLSAKNFNLRFGINLIFGCVKKEDIKNCGCEWLQNAEKKKERLRKLRKK